MQAAVAYGEATGDLTVSSRKLIPLSGGGHPHAAIADVSQEVLARLRAPLEFPPLSQAVVPGDHAVLVLDQGVPRPHEILAPLVECLIDYGVNVGDIEILETWPIGTGCSRGALSSDAVPPGIRFQRHDPSNAHGLSYLATTQTGIRVYLNRSVVDADVVILVGRIGYHPIIDYQGTVSSVFPGLADARSIQQFLGQLGAATSKEQRRDFRNEIEEIGWLLGVQFAVQVVVGPGGQVIELLAGETQAVQRSGQRTLDETWRRLAPEPADLVVACISGRPREHGFAELGSALSAAQRLVRNGGRIVLLSDIAADPGPSLEWFRSLSELEELNGSGPVPSEDAVCTCQIARACQHAHVFLLSRMDESLVEDLFMCPVRDLDEVQRLLDQAQSYHILNDAHLTLAMLEGDDE